MRFCTVFLVAIFAWQCRSQSTVIEERKSNMVVKILDKVLEDVIQGLTGNITIPLVDLSELGSFNVTLSIPKITKWTDGVGSYGFQLNMNVSEIIAAGYYDIKNLEILELLTVFGKGDFAVNVDAVNLKLKVKATPNFATDKFEFDFAVFDIQVLGSKLNFDNLMGDPDVSDFLNELLGNLIPNLVQALREPLLSLLKPLLDFYGNGVVDCIKNELNDLENCIKNLFGTFVNDIEHRLGFKSELSTVFISLFEKLPQGFLRYNFHLP